MTLEQRLARLERRNRWLTTALALVLLALGGVVLVAWKQDKPKVLEEVVAKRFVLVDESGEIILGALHRSKSNCSSLMLRGKRGEGPNSNLRLSAADDGGCRLQMNVGNAALVAGVSEDSSEVVASRKGMNHSAIQMKDCEDGTGISLGQQGEGFIRVGAFRGTSMWTSSPGEERKREFTPSKDPAPRVLVQDKDMKPLFKAPE